MPTRCMQPSLDSSALVTNLGGVGQLVMCGYSDARSQVHLFIMGNHKNNRYPRASQL